MGDYTRNGIKIGTFGRGYYATKKMLEDNSNDPECKAYLNPDNGCVMAFPFPEWDNKSIGSISIFHAEDRINYTFPIDEKNENICCKEHNDYQLMYQRYTTEGNKMNIVIECTNPSCNGGLKRKFNIDCIEDIVEIERNIMSSLEYMKDHEIKYHTEVLFRMKMTILNHIEGMLSFHEKNFIRHHSLMMWDEGIDTFKEVICKLSENENQEIPEFLADVLKESITQIDWNLLKEIYDH